MKEERFKGVEIYVSTYVETSTDQAFEFGYYFDFNKGFWLETSQMTVTRYEDDVEYGDSVDLEDIKGLRYSGSKEYKALTSWCLADSVERTTTLGFTPALPELITVEHVSMFS